jgi:putative tryptophan/tyrosine transport system substrate-binding protein
MTSSKQATVGRRRGKHASQNLLVIVFLLPHLLLPTLAKAQQQQSTKLRRIGYISGTGTAGNRGPYVEALRQGLRDLGYTEGKHFAIEYRGAEGQLEPVPSLVAELVQMNVDVLVLPLASAVRVAERMTKTIPIVMITQIDPVAAGLVKGLAQPGGNITGIATLARDLSGKRLELFAEVIPRLSRVAILRGANEPVSDVGFKEYENAARALIIQVQSLGVRGSDPDLEGAFETAVKGRAQGIITIANIPLFRNSARIAKLAMKNRLPSLHEGGAWVEAGGLLSYSANDVELFRRAAMYVDKIFKGAKPGELPVEQPTKFELVINLKTAKQIGLIIPPNVLARADRVIK